MGKNLACLCQRATTSCPTQIHCENINFDIEVKGQGHTEFMNVCDTSYHGDTLTCQTKYDYVKGQQEAHGPHRSPEKTVQIIKQIRLYHNVDSENKEKTL